MAMYKVVDGVQVELTPAEEAAVIAERDADGIKRSSENAAAAEAQARKDMFKAHNDNKPVTVGDLRGILEDAGVI